MAIKFIRKARNMGFLSRNVKFIESGGFPGTEISFTRNRK